MPPIDSSFCEEEKILDTPISWNLLERDFLKAFDSQAKLGKSNSARIIGNGMGYVSKIVLVEFDWINDENGLLPKSAVLKITIAPEKKPVKSEQNGPQKFDPRELNDIELKFYQRSTNPKEIPSSLKLPRFYWGRSYGEDGLDAGYIAMEHLGGTVDRHIYQNVDETGTIEAVDQLLELAVFSINNPAQLEDWPRIGKTLFDHFLASENLEEKLAKRCELFTEFKPHMEILRKYFGSIYGDYEKFRERRINTCRTPILCQGDIWTPNILWTIDEVGTHHVKAFIDWQLVHVGSPLEDLVFLFHSALSVDDYQNRINFYLHYYFDTLDARLQATSKALPWKDFDEFKQQYEIAYAYMLGLLWPISLMILDEEIQKDASFLDGFGANLVEKTLFQAGESNRILEKYF